MNKSKKAIFVNAIYRYMYLYIYIHYTVILPNQRKPTGL